MLKQEKVRNREMANRLMQDQERLHLHTQLKVNTSLALFWSNEMLEMIVQYTNIYISEISDRLKIKSTGNLCHLSKPRQSLALGMGFLHGSQMNI